MSAIIFDAPEALQRRQHPRHRQAPPGSQWNRATPRSTAPEWLLPVLQDLSRLSGLPNNWDGYGSPSVRPEALQTAHKTVAALEQLDLPMPQVCPVTGGGIGFTWQLGGRELEIEILPDGSAQYLAVVMDPATGQEETGEGALPSDPTAYARLAAWLTGG